jgi:hypothetical protein
VRGVFRPNPLAEYFRALNRFTALSQLFTDLAKDLPKSVPNNVNIAQVKQQTGQIKKFVDNVLTDLEKSKRIIIVIDFTDAKNNQKGVFYLSPESIGNFNVSDFAYKEYRVLAKVVRKLSDDQDLPIDLLPGTAMAGMGKKKMTEVITQLNTGFDNQEMNIPKAESSVTAPALELIPLAIYA